MATLLGQKIHQLRKKKKLTLDALAVAAEMSKSYIWELENMDSQRPSAAKLTAIGDALGVSGDYFLDDNVNAPEERHLDDWFYRNYLKLDPGSKEQLRKIVDAFKAS